MSLVYMLLSLSESRSEDSLNQPMVLRGGLYNVVDGTMNQSLVLEPQTIRPNHSGPSWPTQKYRGTGR